MVLFVIEIVLENFTALSRFNLILRFGELDILILGHLVKVTHHTSCLILKHRFEYEQTRSILMKRALKVTYDIRVPIGSFNNDLGV